MRLDKLVCSSAAAGYTGSSASMMTWAGLGAKEFFFIISFVPFMTSGMIGTFSAIANRKAPDLKGAIFPSKLLVPSG